MDEKRMCKNVYWDRKHSQSNNKKRNLLNSESFIWMLLSAVIGIITFLLIYGFAPLNVTNDRWILSGYDESDIIQHYAGWLAYRNSPWKFPLGLADNIAVGTGTIISFTDSIPVVAIIFKLLRNILPETFQYLGIYTLLCYILQSIASFKIIKLKTDNNIYSLIGTWLFSFSPILIERAFRHTALGSQWLIIFSIYLYLKYCEQKCKKTYIFYLILEILAIGIHPYFLPMVAVFAFLCVISDVKERKYIAVIYFLIMQMATYLFGMMIGVLGSGANLSREGYGYYSMNLNALINPTSCGKYVWSSLLKTHPQILGNYDGFNYMGAGVLAFILIIITLVICLKKQNLVFSIVKYYKYLAIICIFLTCFAVTNVVTFNDHIVLTVPFPASLINICGVFRASSRLFYPVYYIIYSSLIILLWKIAGSNKLKYAYGVLIFIVVLQIFDIHECIIQKHQAMDNNKSYSSYIEDSYLKKISLNADNVLLEEYDKSTRPMIRTLAVWAFKNNMSTYYPIANSGNYDKTLNLADELLTEAKISGNLKRNIIVTTNGDICDFYKQFINIEIYKIEGIYFLFHKD